MERSAGLVVVSALPTGRVAILQRRGTWNAEKMKPASFPGLCQVTAHGKAKDGEDLRSTLEREIAEELGEVAVGILRTPDWNLVSRLDTPEKEVETYAVQVPPENLQGLLLSIRLESSSGGIQLLSESTAKEIIAVDPKNSEYKAVGIRDLQTVGMFPDEKDAVIAAFRALS